MHTETATPTEPSSDEANSTEYPALAALAHLTCDNRFIPDDLFVDLVLVSIRDAGSTRPGSDRPLADDARQAATLATAEGGDAPLVAAALLMGFGHVVTRSFARHPAAEGLTFDPDVAGATYLSSHLPEATTGPLALLPVARRYLPSALVESDAAPTGLSPTERMRFERHLHAADAVTLATIEQRLPNATLPMAPLGAYRTLLYDLARGGRDPEVPLTPGLRLVS